MKKIFLILSIFVFQFTNGQLDPNGILILNSGTTAEINAISPQTGALVFNTETNKTYVYNGSTWEVATGNNENWTTTGNNQYSAVSGNVGIGTNSPTTKLDVNGRIKSRADGGLGYVASAIHLYSHDDYRGAGIFSFGQTKDWFFGNPYTDHDGKFIIAVANQTGNESVAQISNAQFTVQNDGNVGIGTTSPGAKLEVAGQIKMTGGNPGTGKILTSDANGLATWQDASSTTNNSILIDGKDQTMFGNTGGSTGNCIVSHGIATFFTNASNNNFIHIRLPYTLDSHNEMYHIKATGYRYGAAKIIDITWVGYCYRNGNTLINTSSINNGDSEFSITQYVGSDRHIYLRFRGTTGSNYYQSFRVDSMNVGNGSVLTEGDIQIISSASANL